MDNKKIGKLIAELRNKKGLTQQELGDKVGVGFRAVSKWETGTTLPDITIINELSKILGITSDELLAGELKKKNKTNNEKKKLSPKIKITITIVSSIIILLTSIFLYQYNRTYVYELLSSNAEHYVEGNITFERNKMLITINKLSFKDDELNQTVVKNYEYKIYAKNKLIYGHGYGINGSTIEHSQSIQSVTEEFRLNYQDEIIVNKNKMINDEIIIKFIFLDENGKNIIKEIKMKLLMQ